MVTDVTDLNAVRKAIEKAKAETSRPSLIKVIITYCIFHGVFKYLTFFPLCTQIRTVIGHGSGKQGTEKVHGAPLGAADLKLVKETFSFDPNEVLMIFMDDLICLHVLQHGCYC